jgi:hypothetical protein
MRVKQFGFAALFVVLGAGAAIGAAPIAVADECDPTATICQGSDLQDIGLSPDFAPAPDIDTGFVPGEFEGGNGHDSGGGRR